MFSYWSNFGKNNAARTDKQGSNKQNQGFYSKKSLQQEADSVSFSGKKTKKAGFRAILGLLGITALLNSCATPKQASINAPIPPASVKYIVEERAESENTGEETAEDIIKNLNSGYSVNNQTQVTKTYKSDALGSDASNNTQITYDTVEKEDKVKNQTEQEQVQSKQNDTTKNRDQEQVQPQQSDTTKDDTQEQVQPKQGSTETDNQEQVPTPQPTAPIVPKPTNPQPTTPNPTEPVNVKYAPPEIIDEPEPEPEPAPTEEPIYVKYAPPEPGPEPEPEPAPTEEPIYVKYAPPEPAPTEPVPTEVDEPEPVPAPTEELLKYAPPEILDEEVFEIEMPALKYAPPEVEEVLTETDSNPADAEYEYSEGDSEDIEEQ